MIRWSATIATNIIAEGKGPRIGLLVSEGTGDGALRRRPQPRRRPADRAGEHRRAARRRLRRRDAGRDPRAARAGRAPDRRQHGRRLRGRHAPSRRSGGSSTRTSPTTTSARCRSCWAARSAATRTTRRARTWRWSTPTCTRRWPSRCSRPRTSCSSEHNYRRPVYIAHVNGGVARVAKTKAVDTAESSPYFGLNACAWWARLYGHDKVLALDVGGTTAKLGVIADGKPMTVEHGDLLGVPLKTPWTLLRSAAVGGGSIVRDVRRRRHSSARRPRAPIPAPACYDLGGRAGDADRRVPGRRHAQPRALPRRAPRAARRPRAAGARRRSIDADGERDRHAPPTWSPRSRAARSSSRRRAASFELYCFGGNGGELRRARGRPPGPRPRLRVRARPGAERVRLLRRRDLPRLRGVGRRRHEAIVARGKAQVRRDLAGERMSVEDARFEVEITDRVTVRGYSPVPIFAPQPRAETSTRSTATCSSGRTSRPARPRAAPRAWSPRPTRCAIPAGWAVRIDGYDNAILHREANDGAHPRHGVPRPRARRRALALPRLRPRPRLRARELQARAARSTSATRARSTSR